MRKQTKTVAVASAAALLAIGASMTSFAATGWTEEDGTWYYYDNDGNRLEDEWRRSGDNWYWLDSEENGAMAVDKLIEDDDDTYYVDANGVMVTSTWVRVVNEDQDEEDDPAEYNYYYMQSNGKAYKNTSDNLRKRVIDGKTYAFDEDGRMLYGWVTEDGDLANGEDDWQDAVYYFGSWEDGSMKTGWQRINVYDSTDGKDDDYDYWFSFKSNGKKRTHDEDNKTWKSNGKYYHFNENGVMVYEWFQTNSASASGVETGDQHSASNWAYFSSPEDGARMVKGWFKVVAPTEDNSFMEDVTTFANDDSSDESEVWYYSNGHDEGLVAGEIKKIKGKYYAFWPDDGENGGRMLSGLNALRMNAEDGSIIEEVIKDDMDSDDLDDFMDAVDENPSAYENVYLYYFGDSDNEDTDGAMKDGNVTINLDGDNYQFSFRDKGGAESRGRGLTGVDDGDYIYKFGQRIKADSDEKYILVHATGDINDDNVIVTDYDSSDVRRDFKDTTVSGDEGTIRVVYGFGTADRESSTSTEDEYGWYLVNTGGRIQTGTKSGTKDGDDWYWFMRNDNIIMYTNEKDLDDSVLDGTWRNCTKSSDLDSILNGTTEE